MHFRKFGTPAAIVKGRPHLVALADKNSWLCQFPKGISTAWGESLDSDTYFYPECSFSFIDREVSDPQYEVMRLGVDRCKPNVYVSEQSVLSLSMNFAYQRNYFHWLFDVLPRLEIARQAGCEFDMVYCANERAFQQDSLLALGVESQQCIATEDVSIVQAAEMIIPSVPNSFRTMPLWVVEFLQQVLRPTLTSTDYGGSCKLLISREDAKRRRTLNELALQERLIVQGFEVVIPSKLSIVEQATLFANAESVVACHGAAMANIVFCSPGTKVLEIAAPKYHWDLFGDLARHAKLDFRCVTANRGSPSITEEQKFKHQYTDFEIDFEFISSSLDWIAS